MNQTEQMREDLEPIWYMHDNHCFTKLEGGVEQCLATLERLLNEGETYGMLCSKRKGFEYVHQKGTGDRVNFLNQCKAVLEKALTHVNETPKNEHDSEDMLKPAKLVRLTEDDVATAWNLAHENTISHAQYDPERFDFNFANAIMDAFLQKNGLDK